MTYFDVVIIIFDFDVSITDYRFLHISISPEISIISRLFRCRFLSMWVADRPTSTFFDFVVDVRPQRAWNFRFWHAVRRNIYFRDYFLHYAAGCIMQILRRQAMPSFVCSDIYIYFCSEDDYWWADVAERTTWWLFAAGWLLFHESRPLHRRCIDETFRNISMIT